MYRRPTLFLSSIIEATINKDILMDTPISKPALLRQTFELGAAYSGQLLSLNKMLGTLQDAFLISIERKSSASIPPSPTIKED